MANPLDRMRKLNSRLRCVANGDSNVNAVRAQQNGAVRLKPAAQKLKVPDIVSLTTDDSIKQLTREINAITRGPKQKDLPKDVEVSVFVLLNRESAKSPDLVTHRNGRVGTATVSIADLHKLDSDPVVQSIELAETLRVPAPRIATSTPTRPSVDRFALYNAGTVGVAGTNRTIDDIGKNVLIGIIDVGGIDFAHEDFMDDAGNSRVIRIWDQGGYVFDPPQPVASEGKAGKIRGRGSEITAEHIAFALKEAKTARVSPHDLAPQSQKIRGSHATHVASIAAGRSGLCKRAKIAAVLLSLPDADNDRRKSFYDTTCLVDGLAYLFALAEADKDIEAISINISLGTNGGAHDGSELLSRWIDASMTEPGRSICVAAGNSGQDAPEFEGDTGIWSGRVHSSGRIAAAGLRRDLQWIVVGNGVEDVSENELEIWYNAQDEFDVELFTPNGIRIGPVSAGQRVENLLLADRTVVSIYNTLSDPKNGDNRIPIYLSPYMGEPIVGITVGSWKVRLTGKVVRNGAYNAWIERDDPSRGPVGTHWRLPSFFGPDTFVDHSTLSSLACGPRVIGVANFDEAREQLNTSSSQGPTRDGRMKPEIAAPGTGIVAACGFDPQNKWIEMTGTSMASPYVAGVAGLMLSLNPQLTAAQIGGIIQRTSQPLPGSGYEWQNGSGFGVIDPGAGMREVVRMIQRERPNRQSSDANEGQKLMQIEVFPAASGDCLLLTSSDDRRLLADAGLPHAYDDFIATPLSELRTAQKEIDIVYVSHIDRDHIGGVLRMLDDEMKWRAFDHMKLKGKDFKQPVMPRPPVIRALWHNAFLEDISKSESMQLGSALANSANAMAGLIVVGLGTPEMVENAERAEMLALSVGDAIEVNWRIGDDQLGIPLNPDFDGQFMVARPKKPIELGSMTITVLGPTTVELNTLRKEWIDWLKKKKDYVETLRNRHRRDIEDLRSGLSPMDVASQALAIEKDVTPPNLASLVLLVEENGRRILLTGDAGDESLLKYLTAAKLIGDDKRLEVDVLKVPHHGADNSYSKRFVESIRASHYIFCGDGEHHNPEPDVVEGYLKAVKTIPLSGGAETTFWFNCSAARCATKHLKLWQTIEGFFGPGGIAPEAKAHFLSKSASRHSLHLT